MVSTSRLYNAEHPLKLIWETSFLYLKKKKSQIVFLSNSNRKWLLQLQKHYT